MRNRGLRLTTLLLATGFAVSALWFFQACEQSRQGLGPDARSAKDASGREWLLLVSEPSSQADLSKPLVGTVVARKRGSEVIGLSVTLQTAGGQRVRSVTVNGRPPPQPEFTITDASGAEVARGKFEYG